MTEDMDLRDYPLAGTAAKAGLKTALEDSDQYVQVAAAWGLASVGEKEGLDALDKALGVGGKDFKLSIFAGEALISIPDRDVESKPE